MPRKHPSNIWDRCVHFLQKKQEYQYHQSFDINRLEKYYTSLFTTFSINLLVFLSRTILYPPARCDKTQRETVAKNR